MQILNIHTQNNFLLNISKLFFVKNGILFQQPRRLTNQLIRNESIKTKHAPDLPDGNSSENESKKEDENVKEDTHEEEVRLI